MSFIILLIIPFGIGYYSYIQNKKKQNNRIQPTSSIPENWRIILTENISYYNALSISEKTRFEFKVYEFILNYKIVGVRTEINITDKWTYYI